MLPAEAAAIHAKLSHAIWHSGLFLHLNIPWFIFKLHFNCNWEMLNAYGVKNYQFFFYNQNVQRFCVWNCLGNIKIVNWYIKYISIWIGKILLRRKQHVSEHSNWLSSKFYLLFHYLCSMHLSSFIYVSYFPLINYMRQEYLLSLLDYSTTNWISMYVCKPSSDFSM